MNNELKDKILVLESEISRLNKRAIDGGQGEDLMNDIDGTNSIAQELLRKLMRYEEENNKLKYEKERLQMESMEIEDAYDESVSLMYSIVADNFVS